MRQQIRRPGDGPLQRHVAYQPRGTTADGASDAAGKPAAISPPPALYTDDKASVDGPAGNTAAAAGSMLSATDEIAKLLAAEVTSAEDLKLHPSVPSVRSMPDSLHEFQLQQNLLQRVASMLKAGKEERRASRQSHRDRGRAAWR